MGFEKLAEELGGAFAAEKALDAANPDANFLEKAAAAAVGFEGGGMLGDALGGLLHKKDNAPEADTYETQPDQAEAAPEDDQNA